MTEVLAIDLKSMEYDATQRIEDPEDIVTLCGALVVSQSGMLKLAHYSVKEYLTSNRLLSSPQFTYYVSSKDSHICITQTCLLYLRHYDQRQRKALQSHPHALIPAPCQSLLLYPYSISVWAHHYELSGKPVESTVLALDVLGNPSSIFASEAWDFPSPTLHTLGWLWNTAISTKHYSPDSDWIQIERETIDTVRHQKSTGDSYMLDYGNRLMKSPGETKHCYIMQPGVDAPNYSKSFYKDQASK